MDPSQACSTATLALVGTIRNGCVGAVSRGAMDGACRGPNWDHELEKDRSKDERHVCTSTHHGAQTSPRAEKRSLLAGFSEVSDRHRSYDLACCPKRFWLHRRGGRRDESVCEGSFHGSAKQHSDNSSARYDRQQELLLIKERLLLIGRWNKNARTDDLYLLAGRRQCQTRAS